MRLAKTTMGVGLGLAMALLSLGAAEARTLRISHNQVEIAPVHQSMLWLANRVSELTNGDLTVEVYPNATLGTQRESVELVQSGVLDMAKSNAAELEAFDPIYSVFNVPYLFTDEDHFYSVLASEAGQDLLKHSASKGFIGLTYYDGGARSFYAKKPINSPADLKGLKVRVQPSPTAIQMIELMGGSPTPLAYGELYTALKQGVVDAAENNPSALTGSRHGEVANFYSEDEHTRIPDVLVISTMVWDSLNPEQQAALKQAADESMTWHRTAWTDYVNDSINEAKNDMGVTFVQVDKEPFRQATAPIYNEIAGQSEENAAMLAAFKALE